MRARPLSDDERASIDQMHATGMGASAIAAAVGRRHSVVVRYLAVAHGRAPTQRRRRFTTAEDAALDAALLDGESYDEIGRRLGRHPHVVADHACRLGLAERRPWTPASDRQGIVDWYRRGERIGDIMARFGVRESTVYAALRAANEPLRRPGQAEARRLARLGRQGAR